MRRHLGLLFCLIAMVVLTGCAREAGANLINEMPEPIPVHIIDNTGIGVSFDDMGTLNTLVHDLGYVFYNIGEDYNPHEIIFLAEGITPQELMDDVESHNVRSELMSSHIISVTVLGYGRLGVVVCYVAYFENINAERDVYYMVLKFVASRSNGSMIAQDIEFLGMASVNTHILSFDEETSIVTFSPIGG